MIALPHLRKESSRLARHWQVLARLLPGISYRHQSDHWRPTFRAESRKVDLSQPTETHQQADRSSARTATDAFYFITGAHQCIACLRHAINGSISRNYSRYISRKYRIKYWQAAASNKKQHQALANPEEGFPAAPISTRTSTSLLKHSPQSLWSLDLNQLQLPQRGVLHTPQPTAPLPAPRSQMREPNLGASLIKQPP